MFVCLFSKITNYKSAFTLSSKDHITNMFTAHGFATFSKWVLFWVDVLKFSKSELSAMQTSKFDAIHE